MIQEAFSKKQLQFITAPKAKWNIAHGSVRTGKTVGLTFAFMVDADQCPDSKIYIVGKTCDTAYRNVIRLITESPEFITFRPFCSWSGKKLYFKDKVITVLGAKDEGAIGNFYGDTYSLVLCDEIALYPQSIIEIIDSRLSKPYSRAYATCNPQHPTHIIKKWIDKGIEGDPNYYSMHFVLEDNPFVDQDYKDRLKNSSGLFYKRNYLGLWCLAEGAIFEFFDRNVHVVSKPPRAAEYYLCGVDYGVSNAFAAVIVGVSTGKYTQEGRCWWVEKEYFWDSHKMHRTKINSEFANDVMELIEPYGIRQIYIDPSAASMKEEFSRRGIHPIGANNDVLPGIEKMTTEMGKGNLYVMNTCSNLIREIETYVWDEKKSKLGEDAPLKKADHAVDALRYVIASHIVSEYKPYKDGHDPDEYRQGRFNPTARRF